MYIQPVMQCRSDIKQKSDLLNRTTLVRWKVSLSSAASPTYHPSEIERRVTSST